VPGIALTPHWCPPGLTPNQRRRIQRMKAQKLRKEATKKERDNHFNVIRLMIPAKQEWRVEENSNVPAFTTSNDDMDLLDDDEYPLIKDRSPPPTDMDINIVFTLPAKFMGVKDEIA
jgi:hypothetical protein